jgi:hypothetical protein
MRRVTIMSGPMIRPMPLNAAGVLRDSEHTLNAAHDAASHTTDRTADGYANRASSAVADGCSLLSTAHDSLSLNGSGHGKNGEAECGEQDIPFHEVAPS